MKRPTLSFPGLAVLAAFLLMPSAARPAEGPPPLSLEMPVRCIPAKTCWVVNYVDLDPSDGVRDYACGTATYNVPSKQGNRHKGTDIAIRDLGEMRRGVEVLAAAAGKVIGVRDGMADVSVRKIGVKALKGKLCGNRLGILHPGGWLTQYCHLRQGSVAVANGDRVKAGQPIGLVGLSGFTEYPHLHLEVIKKTGKGQKTIDPFIGLTRQAKCGTGDNPLWKRDVLAGFPYRPTAIYNAGFASTKPDPKAARDGRYRDKALSGQSPALVLWAEIFHVRKGDKLIFDIRGPEGKGLLFFTDTILKNQVRRFAFAGKPQKGGPWPPGVYTGVVRLVREKGPRGDEAFSLVRQVTLR